MSGELALDVGWVLNPGSRPLRDPRVVVEDGRVVHVGERGNPGGATSGHDRISYPRGICVPGLVNAHTHVGETLLRGLCGDLPLHQWLYDNVWRVEPHMTAEDAYWGALLGCAEMLAGGTTAFVDQYFFAGEVARAVVDSGMKAYLCPSVFDGTPESGPLDDAFRRALQVHSEWHGKEGRVFVGLGPHAPYSVPPEALARVADAAKERDVLLHLHLSETRREVEEAKAEWNATPVQRCADLDVLGANVLAAHCVHVDDRDVRVLAEKGVSVAHCPQSNMKLASGVAPIAALDAAGVNVCVGTDGQASNDNLDLLEELRTASLLQKVASGDPTAVGAEKALAFATENPARLFGGAAAARLEPGQPADLAVFDAGRPEGVPLIDPLTTWAFSLPSAAVVLTVVGGRVLYLDRQFQTLDLERVLERAQAASEEMRRKAGEAGWTPSRK
ncbi:MAG: amidohydrolase [Promethearchaeota archaeon]